MKRLHRRGFLAGLAGAIALPVALPGTARAQNHRPIGPLLDAVSGGASVRKGRVTLELPSLADNGHAVPLKVSVDSPMTAADHVKSIHLLSDRNPVAEMSRFLLGPRSGRAEVATRIRLAGSQTVTAVAALSDGTFWMDSAQVVVTLSACLDES